MSHTWFKFDCANSRRLNCTRFQHALQIRLPQQVVCRNGCDGSGSSTHSPHSSPTFDSSTSQRRTKYAPSSPITRNATALCPWNRICTTRFPLGSRIANRTRYRCSMASKLSTRASPTPSTSTLAPTRPQPLGSSGFAAACRCPYHHTSSAPRSTSHRADTTPDSLTCMFAVSSLELQFAYSNMHPLTSTTFHIRLRPWRSSTNLSSDCANAQSSAASHEADENRIEPTRRPRTAPSSTSVQANSPSPAFGILGCATAAFPRRQRRRKRRACACPSPWRTRHPNRPTRQPNRPGL